MLTYHNLKGFWLAARPKNLLIAFLTFTLAAFCSYNKSFLFLQNPLFYIQAFLILLIMASGYFINDLFDYKIDLINKPHKTFVNIYASSKKFWTTYWVINITIILFTLMAPPFFIFLNYSALLLLYLYARYFKRYAGIGNLIIASLTTFVVIAGGMIHQLNLTILWISIFAFLITLIREIVKDIEDLRGDLKNNLQTLPILAGIHLTHQVLFTLYILLIIAVLLPIPLYYFLFNRTLWLYGIFTLLAIEVPLIHSIWTLLRSQYFQKSRYTYESKRLKFIMLIGVIACLLL